jgi:hypothetical protein
VVDETLKVLFFTCLIGEKLSLWFLVLPEVVLLFHVDRKNQTCKVFFHKDTPGFIRIN